MTISIIIPTCNRGEKLKITLASIFRQLDLKDTEIIVVDNGSTDDTANICSVFSKEYFPSLKYFYDAEPGLLTGRHLGALVAQNEILCFLDDDVELSPNWTTGVKDAFNDMVVELATGPCLPKYETEPPTWIKSFWLNFKDGGKVCSWLSLIDFGNKKKFIDPNFVWGLNFCIRKCALKALGGFHPDNIPADLQIFQGDGESGLTIKAQELDYKALYHPEIMLYHIISSERLTLEYFEKRAFYKGICKSFTSLKKLGQNKSRTKKSKVFSQDLNETYSSLLHQLKLYKLKLNRMIFTAKEIKIIENVLSTKEKEGFNFHQEAYKKNDKVKEWVLKNDYWNYKLPAS